MTIKAGRRRRRPALAVHSEGGEAMRRSTDTARWVAAVAALGVGGSLSAGTIEAIYTNIPGHPTAQVPGVPGEEFRSPLAPFLTLYGSPIGAHWIFKAFTDNPDSNANDVIVAGSGTTGVACVELGREFLGFEIDPDYCKLANERLSATSKGITLAEERTGQGTLF